MMIPRGPLALLRGGVTGLLVLAGVTATFHFAGLRVNASSSLPIGLYRTTTSPAENLVEFCPPEPFGSLSAARGYRGRGRCPDGFEPLMKPIVATAGDMVDVSAIGIAINGGLITNSAPQPFDTKRRPLAHWPFGTYRVASGAVWVVSSFNRRSFDSRYFGPMPISSIRSHLRPLVTEWTLN